MHDGPFDRTDKYGDRYCVIEKSPRWVQKLVLDLRKNLSSGLWSIAYTKHAQDRLVARGVQPDDVLFVLTNGTWKESRLYEKRQDRERHVFRGFDEQSELAIEVVFVIEKNVVVVTVWGEKK